MNYPSFFFAIILSVATACHNTNETLIRGTLKGIPDQRVYLSDSWRGQEFTDSTQLIGGEFEFEPIGSYPRRIYLHVKPAKMPLLILVESGKIEVNGEFDSVFHYEVTGTPANLEFAHYRETFIQGKQELEKALTSALSTSDTLRIENLRAQLRKYAQTTVNLFVRHKPTSLVSAMLLADASTFEVSSHQLDSLLQLLVQVPQNSFTDKLVEKRDRLKAIAVGQKAPDFTLKNTDGVEVSLSQFKGKCVLLDFWSSACGPCRQENPHLLKLYQKYNARGFMLISISLDKTRANWLRAIEEDQLIWPQLSSLKGGDCPVAQTYCVTRIPHTFLIDKKGVIIANSMLGAELDSAIVRILGDDPLLKLDSTASQQPKTFNKPL